ncbi:MAG: D-sedoheptulose-7-phosphate isomerase [Athalassotoga sp.]|uniref:D-sedoheptulose-7-phosphate isomerase n=1 Tax=Athalassotoga sp. TaxID=2022597 RepID=UPI003D02947A
MDLEKIVADAFEESVSVKEKFVKAYSKQIIDLSSEIAKRVKNGGGVFFMGNGGSAADAAHLSAELVGKFYMNRSPIKSASFASNLSILTEIPNDFGFEYLFERQVEAYVKPTDVIVGISTSGKSVNVIRALKKAKEIGAFTVGFTGRYGDEMKICDVLFKVDSDKTPRIQETHILLGHTLCQLIEYEMFGDDKS